MYFNILTVLLIVISFVLALEQSDERSVIPIAVVITPNADAQNINDLLPLVKNLGNIGDVLPNGLTSFAFPSFQNRNWGQPSPYPQNGNSIDQYQRPHGHPHFNGNHYPQRPGNAQPEVIVIDRHRPHHHHRRPRPHYPLQPGNHNQQFYPGWPMYNVQPQYPNQQIHNGNQPIYNGNQPMYNGNQPMYNGNQPIYNGNQPQYPGQHFDNSNQEYPPTQPENPDQYPDSNQTPPTLPNQPITQPPFKPNPEPSVKPSLPVLPQPNLPPTFPITELPSMPVNAVTPPPQPSLPETDEAGKDNYGQPEFDFDVRFGGE